MTDFTRIREHIKQHAWIPVARELPILLQQLSTRDMCIFAAKEVIAYLPIFEKYNPDVKAVAKILEVMIQGTFTRKIINIDLDGDYVGVGTEYFLKGVTYVAWAYARIEDISSCTLRCDHAISLLASALIREQGAIQGLELVIDVPDGEGGITKIFIQRLELEGYREQLWNGIIDRLESAVNASR